MNLRRLMLGAAVSACLVAALPALAHHSTAAYDSAKPITLKGGVKAFHWKNPHIFIILDVTDSNGASIEWIVECGTPNINARNGWKRDSIKPGDRITAQVNPARDGSRDGQARTITLPDGTVLQAPGSD